MTYARLQTDILDTLNRQDFAGNTVQRFIRLAETALDAELSGAARHTEAKDIYTAGGYIPLPADFRSVQHIQIDGQTVTLRSTYNDRYTGDRLEYGADEIVFLPDGASAITSQIKTAQGGEPCEYYISGNRLWFSPQPVNGTRARLTYIAGLERLSATNETNWVLERYEDVYLYGALIHSAPHLRNDERISTWASLYRAALDRANQDYMDSQMPVHIQLEPSTHVV